MEYEIENIIKLFYSKYKLQDEEIDDDLFVDKKEINYLEYFKINLIKKVKFDYKAQPPFKLFYKDYIISSEIYQKLKFHMDNLHNIKNILKNNNYQNNLLDITKILIYCQENSSCLNYFIESYANETFEKIRIKIIKSHDLKNKEYHNHLQRFFYFMNIFFRLKNDIFKNINNEKVDFENASKTVLNNINNIFNEFKGEEIIKNYKKSILTYIDDKQKDFNIKMEENENNVEQTIDLINKKIDKEIIDLFKEEITKELSNVENKIVEQMKNIGISETGLIDKNINIEKSLGYKIFLGFHYCTLRIGTIVFGIGYGLLCALPNFVVNKFNDKRKFNQFINDKKIYVEKIMKSYSYSIKKNIKKFKNYSLENVKRLLGLLKTRSIQTDEFWKYANKEYLIIFSNYKEIYNLENK